MVQYDVSLVKKQVTDFCRFPVPRAPIEIVRHLKKINPDFYAKTPDAQVVKFLRKEVLVSLVSNSILVQYLSNNSNWEKSRKLLYYYYKKENMTIPRKLTELYQINFLCLSDDSLLFSMPSFVDINQDATALLYNFIKDKKIPNFSLNLLNLLYCYSKDETYDRIRIAFYNLSFEEKERATLERMLEVCRSSDSMQLLFNAIPFQPDLSKAINFLSEL